MLNRAVELVTNTREVEELDELGISSEEIPDREQQVQVLLYNTKIIHSYRDFNNSNFFDVLHIKSEHRKPAQFLVLENLITVLDI